MGLTTEEKVFIVEHYFRSYGKGKQGGPSLKLVTETYREQFHKEAPTNKVMLSIVEKFRRSGSVLCQRKGRSGRPVTVRTNGNHGRVLNQVLQSPNRSLRRTAFKLNISSTSIRRLFKDVGGFPYRIQVGQRLSNQDMNARVAYCGQFLAMLYENPDFLNNVWFSDESHIHLEGYINKQTTRFLGFDKPDVIIQKPLHSARVTIWCAVSAHGVIGPYFIEDDDGTPLTVTQERYRNIVVTPFVQDLRRFCRARDLRMEKQWFQQDGATSHTARQSIALLQETFEGRIISRSSNFNYPSHSPDLTPPDAYVWGMLKEKVFSGTDPPRTVNHLREKIVSFFRNMQQPVFSNMFENLRNRYEQCLQRHGAHFEHVFYRHNNV